jgi:hypothetical protein
MSRESHYRCLLCRMERHLSELFAGPEGQDTCPRTEFWQSFSAEVRRQAAALILSVFISPVLEHQNFIYLVRHKFPRRTQI